MNFKKYITLLLSVLVLNVVTGQTKKNVPGIDLIGKTYDIFKGEYANNRYAKTSILDFSKAPIKEVSYQNVVYYIPEIFEYTNIVDSKSKITSGESMSEISESLNTSAGLSVNALVFSASVNLDVFKERNQDKYNYYSKYYYIIQNHRISIRQVENKTRRERFVQTLKTYLEANFKEDINDPLFSPEDVFKNYGTHFLGEVILGAKIEQNIRIESESILNKSQIEAGVSAEYKSVGGNLKVGNTTSTSNKNQTYTSIFSAKGGDIALLGDANQKSESYNLWSSSVKKNPVLVDFTENSLVPIWELADDTTRKNQLQAYFNNVLIPKNRLPKNIENKPRVKPVEPLYTTEPVAQLDANMKGVQYGSGLAITRKDYDNTKIWLNTSPSWNQKESYSYWWFYHSDAARKNVGKSGYQNSGNTSKAKYENGVKDRFTIKSPVIDQNGDFYVYIYVKNDNSSGARAANSVRFDQWVRSDNTINVKQVNAHNERYVTFFNGDLGFWMQF